MPEKKKHLISACWERRSPALTSFCLKEGCLCAMSQLIHLFFKMQNIARKLIYPSEQRPPLHLPAAGHTSACICLEVCRKSRALGIKPNGDISSELFYLLMWSQFCQFSFFNKSMENDGSLAGSTVDRLIVGVWDQSANK